MSVRQCGRISKGSAMAMSTDRRFYQRVPLRLPVTTLGSQGNGGGRKLSTANVSAGGMLVRMPSEAAPGPGLSVRFELSVPPGEGYSASPCLISGRGRVVRTEAAEEGQCGVAVEFTERLALGM